VYSVGRAHRPADAFFTSASPPPDRPLRTMPTLPRPSSTPHCHRS